MMASYFWEESVWVTMFWLITENDSESAEFVGSTDMTSVYGEMVIIGT